MARNPSPLKAFKRILIISVARAFCGKDGTIAIYRHHENATLHHIPTITTSLQRVYILRFCEHERFYLAAGVNNRVPFVRFGSLFMVQFHCRDL